MSDYPPIQLVDENDRPVGEASLDEVHHQGLLHRIVMVMVLSPQGKILLQKRGPKVLTHPNHWDISTAGHVDAGEDYLTAARRELAEEIGLKNVELTKIGHYRSKDTFGDRILDRFKTIYKVTVPEETKFIIQPEEVTEVRWFSADEVQNLIDRHPEEVIYDFKKTLKKFYL